jgi:hypothetical protein
MRLSSLALAAALCHLIGNYALICCTLHRSVYVEAAGYAILALAAFLDVVVLKSRSSDNRKRSDDD